MEATMATTDTTKPDAATEPAKSSDAAATPAAKALRRTNRKSKAKGAATVAATVAGNAKRKTARAAGAAVDKAASGTTRTPGRVSARGKSKARGTDSQPVQGGVTTSLEGVLQNALGQVRRAVDDLTVRAQSLGSGDLPDDARALVRRHPMAAGIGAMAVGFVLARTLRSSAPAQPASRGRTGSGSWFGR
jgi:hypothetical protein